MNFQLNVTRLIITACQEGGRRWVMFHCSVILLGELSKNVEHPLSCCFVCALVPVGVQDMVG